MNRYNAYERTMRISTLHEENLNATIHDTSSDGRTAQTRKLQPDFRASSSVSDTTLGFLLDVLKQWKSRARGDADPISAVPESK